MKALQRLAAVTMMIGFLILFGVVSQDDYQITTGQDPAFENLATKLVVGLGIFGAGFIVECIAEKY